MSVSSGTGPEDLDEEAGGVAPPMESNFDTAAALARVDGNAAFLKELVGVFLKDAESRVSAIRDALTRDDHSAVARAAHSLKGAAASLGADTVSRAAQRIEQLAAEEHWAGARAACAALEVALERVRPVLAELLASDDTPAEPLPRLPSASANACVLVIDDDPTVRLATRQALRVAGFDVLTAATGEEGIRAAHDSAPDVIVLDVVLSGESGLDVCQRIKSDPALADIPLLMASAQRTSSGQRADGLDAGADGYIIRPVENHEFVAWVRAMLRVKAAEESNRYLRAIVDSSHDAIIGVTLDGVVSSWNSGAARIYGYAVTEAVGRPLADLLAHRSNELNDLLQRARHGVHVDGFETVQRRCDGTSVDVSLTVSPIWDGGRRIIGASLIARDIGERKRADEEQARLREQLRQAQKLEAIGRLAGGVAHDFNNRLMVMKGHVQFLLKKLPASDTSRTDAEQIEATIDKCAQLIRQLLAISRRAPIETRAVDLNEVVGEMLPTLRSLLGERIRVRVRAAPGLHRIRGDRGQIDQALMHLAGNARDAMTGSGDTLTVETANVTAAEFAQHVVGGPAQPGSYVMLAVGDNGPGMSPEVRERVFEPFFTTKDGGQGAGLGLATVFGILMRHRGYIGCDSAPGRGTTFRLYFRADDSERPTAVLPKATTPCRPRMAGRQPTILVVEDESNLRELLVQALEDAGYQVRAAASAEEASALAAQLESGVDVLVTDVVMLGESGPMLARRLRRERPNLGVVFISGYTPDTLDLSDPPGARFVQKPFGMNELERAVAEVVGA